jgi:hypothetical protein
MRKIIYSLAIVGALAATLALSTIVASRTGVGASTVGQGTEAALSVSKSTPFELMIKHGKSLPTEQWDAF